MMTNLLFSQANALGKRLAMVLTMLLMLGIGQVWGETVTDEITFGNPGDKNNYKAIKLTKEGTFTDHNNFIWSCSSDAAITNGGGALSACYSYAGNKNTSSSYIEISWTADKDYNVTQFDLNAYANGDNPQIILTIVEQVSTITAPKSKETTFYSFSTNNFLVQLQKGKKITARIQKDASKAVTGIVALKYTFVECTAETSR